jgi:small subunit ribosomal protein S9
MTATKSHNYIAAVGRRKTSTARVRITEAAKNSLTINDKSADAYFATKDLVKVAMEPLHKLKEGAKTYSVTVVVKGGGTHSQAEAIRHGIARALAKTDEATKTEVKKLGFLKRDARAKERRKFGHKKARKSSQWSKR